jgi:hypothetical protein
MTTCPMTICSIRTYLMDNSPDVTPMTTCLIISSSHDNSPRPETTCPMENSPMGNGPHGQLIHWTAYAMKNSPEGHFVPWTTRSMDNALHGKLAQWTICPMGNLLPGYFNPWITRPMQIVYLKCCQFICKVRTILLSLWKVQKLFCAVLFSFCCKMQTTHCKSDHFKKWFLEVDIPIYHRLIDCHRCPRTEKLRQCMYTSPSSYI